MNNFLDKTISLRQMLKWTVGLFFLAMPLYVAAVFLNAWNLKMGGASLNHSPLKERIPEQCKAYAERSLGAPAGRTALDNFLLRGRLRRGSIEALVHGPDLAAVCLGYAVLGGLHGNAAGDANFIQQWNDVDGKSVVTVRVEYHQPYSREKASQK